jgi:hydrogenase-4 component F
VRGLMQAAPITGFFLLAGAFALVGVPPFNIFISKFMIISAGIATGHLWLMAAVMLLLMVAFLALFKMLSSVVLGEKPDHVSKGETTFTTLAPVVILMVLILALGVTMPRAMGSLLDGATQVVSAGSPVAHLTGAGSILGPADLSQPQPLLMSLFRVQVGP